MYSKEPQKGYRKTTRAIIGDNNRQEILPQSMSNSVPRHHRSEQAFTKRVGLIMSSLTHIAVGYLEGPRKAVTAYCSSSLITCYAVCWPYLSFTYQQQTRLSVFCVLLRIPGFQGMLKVSVLREQHNPCKPRGIYVGRTFRPFSVAQL